MAKQNPGNGSGKFNIHTRDMGGWVRFFTDKLAMNPDDLAFFLSHTVAQFFRKHPNLHMRQVVPIVREGETVELHVWYDVHVMNPPEIQVKSGKQ